VIGVNPQHREVTRISIRVDAPVVVRLEEGYGTGLEGRSFFPPEFPSANQTDYNDDRDPE
jgi:hypothetical protein